MGQLIMVYYDADLGGWISIVLDNYFLVDSLVNHVTAYAEPFEVFPRDYNALTNFVNANANNLSGSQLMAHFDYNGGGDLEPYVRQGLVDGIER